MRIVFIGASKFGLRCLRNLQSIVDCDLVGAVTAPQLFSISYRPEGVTNVLHADIAGYCQRHDIPYIVMHDNMQDEHLFEVILDWQPDIFLVAGWYHIIPKQWREMAPAYGLHASLLPDYSGGAPLVWAMINGEDKTGITLFLFDNGVDSGPILGQAETTICFEDTIGSLYSRIEDLGIDLIKIHLPLLAHGKERLIPQDNNRRRTFPQRTPEDGLINWHWSAQETYNFIRAQTKPYPGAFSRFRGKKITIWECTISKDAQLSLNPGELKIKNGLVFVGCGHENLLSISLISENDHEMAAADWLMKIKFQGQKKFEF